MSQIFVSEPWQRTTSAQPSCHSPPSQIASRPYAVTGSSCGFHLHRSSAFTPQVQTVQAILIADNNATNFRPFSGTESVALLPLANVLMIDYALETLHRRGVMEMFVFSSLHYQNFRKNIVLLFGKSLASASWAIGMTVHVIGTEGCRCFGDAMRELDRKRLICGHFILLNANSITNSNLKFILEQHKKTVTCDKGTVATLVFKQASTHIRSGSEVLIAMDTQNERSHHDCVYQELSSDFGGFSHNLEIALLHNLIDPEIAIGSPCMLSLFSDNFDFETRIHFVRGILINEEILGNRIYISLLPRQHYVRKVNNLFSYQIVSNDIINRWTYPLVLDMEQHLQKCYRILILIGQNCRLHYVFIFDNVIVEDNCLLELCAIGCGSKIAANCELKGVIVDYNCTVSNNSQLTKSKMFSSFLKNEKL
uniref:Nucleotidyl transferase domain-containing protein n=1 Tax=Glossina brevipalpis TaxID=37001 RepID=A0A1A9WGD1_9MUSC